MDAWRRAYVTEPKSIIISFKSELNIGNYQFLIRLRRRRMMGVEEGCYQIIIIGNWNPSAGENIIFWSTTTVLDHHCGEIELSANGRGGKSMP